MSLELLNTLGTLLTATVIAATAIAALVQLRHLRAGNQINAMLSIGEELSTAAFLQAQHLVNNKLEATLNDPSFREYHVAYGRAQMVQDISREHEELMRAALRVGNSFEELGILVKNGIVDKNLFLDRYSWVILRNWKKLEKFLALARASSGQASIWENFEYLAVVSEDDLREHPSAYPKGVRRMEIHNPWPLAASPAAP